MLNSRQTVSNRVHYCHRSINQESGWYQLGSGRTLPLKKETVLADKNVTWRTVLVIKQELLAQKPLCVRDFLNTESVLYRLFYIGAQRSRDFDLYHFSIS